MSKPKQARGSVLVVSAPSGGGKTSLTRAAIKKLRELGVPTEISVSYTTRDRRPGERDGVHYHFVSPAQFQAMVRRGAFLEYARVFGRWYGTGRAATEARVKSGVHLLLDIDWQGGRQVRRQLPEAHSVFVLPPSLAALRKRLMARGQDEAKTIDERMRRARAQIRHYREYEHLIINKDFDRALGEMVSLIQGRHLLREGQALRHKSLINKLLE